MEDKNNLFSKLFKENLLNDIDIKNAPNRNSIAS